MNQIFVRMKFPYESSCDFDRDVELVRRVRYVDLHNPATDVDKKRAILREVLEYNHLQGAKGVQIWLK